MNFRHEFKQEINRSDMISIRQRLSAVMQRDAHTKDGKYFIRSIYFDNLDDKALLEKINGVNFREKFRIRLYNEDTSFIRLEKKSKINGLCSKESAPLTALEAEAIAKGETFWMSDSEYPLIRELYSKMTLQGIRPKTIVDYTREAFVFAPGNVRITLDYDIRTGLGSKDFLNSRCVTVPAGDSGIILEIKWDEFLPTIIADAVQLSGRQTSSFSKYAACRIYG